MRRGCRREVVDVGALDGSARTRLTDELFRLYEQIFVGAERERFEHKVTNPPARWTRIQVTRNEDGEAVGYCAVHLFDVELRDGAHTVFRGEAGILREYRGSGATFGFGFAEAIRYKLMHPFEKVWFFCVLVHPSSFHVLSGRFHEIYPSHRRETPPKIQAFMRDLADAFGDRRLKAGDPDIRQGGSITRDSEDETAFWRACGKPDVRFFLKANPGYREGHSLLTLVPLTLGNVFLTAVGLAARKLRSSCFSRRERTY